MQLQAQGVRVDVDEVAVFRQLAGALDKHFKRVAIQLKGRIVELTEPLRPVFSDGYCQTCGGEKGSHRIGCPVVK